jgi:hypothetical protein
VPRARRRSWSSQVRDGGRTISVDRRGQPQLVAEELDEQLREAQRAGRLRVAVELGLLRGERDDLDPLRARRDSSAAEDGGEAEEVARLAPPRRVAEGLELGVRRRVVETDCARVVQVREDGKAGVVPRCRRCCTRARNSRRAARPASSGSTGSTRLSPPAAAAAPGVRAAIGG